MLTYELLKIIRVIQKTCQGRVELACHMVLVQRCLYCQQKTKSALEHICPQLQIRQNMFKCGRGLTLKFYQA